MDMEQPQEQPQPVEAPAPAKAEAPAFDESKLDTVTLQGYQAVKPVGVLLRDIALALDIQVGNAPAVDAEPLISFVRWDGPPRAALDELARICGAKWDVQGGALNFVIGG